MGRRSMNNHTPGPWNLELPDDSADFTLSTIDVDADDEGRVRDYGRSIIEGTLVSGTTEEIEANARLIAAAPDLLAALSNFFCSDCATRAGQPHYPPMRQTCPSCAEARTAIAKATGD